MATTMLRLDEMVAPIVREEVWFPHQYQQWFRLSYMITHI